MFKYKLDNLDGLDESLHGFYELKDGAYFLKVQGAVSEDSVSGLKANHDALLAEKKEQQQRAQEAEAERLRIEREAQESEARKNGDLEAIEASWREKYLNREKELLEANGELSGHVYKLTVGQQAQEIANRLAVKGSDVVLLPHIQNRITLGENGSIRVLDVQGNPSALTIEELEQEFRSNKSFAPLIAAEVGSGGGATGGFGGGAAKTFKDYTEAELGDILKSNPALFQQIVKTKEV